MPYDFQLNLRPLIRTSGVLLLAGALSACDMPWQQAQKSERDQQVAFADAPPQDSDAGANFAALGDVRISARSKAEESPPVDEDPPFPVDVELTPMEDKGDPAGNALLAVRYENAERLDDTLEFVIDEHKYVLKRDGKDPRQFAAMIHFDFDLFVEEQAKRRELIVATGAKDFPVFRGRERVGTRKLEFIDPEALRRARDLSLTIPIRDVVINIPPPPGLDPAATLAVTDLSVVEDPQRTYDVCGNTGNPDGAWTFKTLMTNMANESGTGVDPADFVEDWLQSWNTTHTINGFPVPARNRINTRVLSAWPRIDGKLDLSQSPMRLLAIVNRVDLRSTAIGQPRYGGGNGGIPINAGEGRFVFGVVDRSAGGGCRKMDFTVILEYGVPINQCTAIRSYAQQWHALGNIGLGSAAFNPALQAITDQFTAAGVAPGKPNGSAINQIRTNEVALVGYGGIDIDPSPLSSRRPIEAIPLGGPWELREFHLQSDGMLHIVSTRDTPHHSLNNTSLLANYINTGPGVANGTHTVPLIWAGAHFLTGSTIYSSVADSAVWKAPGAIVDRRHQFSLKTCSGCHAGEARYNNNPLQMDSINPTLPMGPDTSFVHITPRDFNVQSDVSKFMIGAGSLSSPSSFQKNDPINPTSVTRGFGDLQRRQLDLASLSGQSCRSTAILQEALFRRIDAVH